MQPDKKFKLLLVCTGNTCRSPMAAGILRKLLDERGITRIEVESAGVSAHQGSPASLFSIETCRNYGIDISRHSSRQLTTKMASAADLILVMAPEHLDYMDNLDPALLEKSFLVKAFPGEADSDQNYTVPDPIGRDRQAYLSSFFELDEHLRRILPALLNLAAKR